MWEGGIRIPGMVHYPGAITSNMNITTPATTADFLPTIMSLLQVESDNPTWAMDGVDLLPIIQQNQAKRPEQYVPRSQELRFWTNNQQAIIDNNWKLVRNPGIGQCDFQEPYKSWKNVSVTNHTFLFDLDNDYHELYDLSTSEPQQFQRMSALLDVFLASVNNSQANEVGCGKYAPPPAPTPTPPPTPQPQPRSDCQWALNMGQKEADIYTRGAASREDCCAMCWAEPKCVAADFTGGKTCHIKGKNNPIPRADGSVSCVPLKNATLAAAHWLQYD